MVGDSDNIYCTRLLKKKGSGKEFYNVTLDTHKQQKKKGGKRHVNLSAITLYYNMVILGDGSI